MKKLSNLRNIFQDLAIVSIFFGIARISSFLIFAVTARIYSEEDFATLVFVFGISQVLSQLAGLGWPALIIRLTSKISSSAQGYAKGFLFRSVQIPLLIMAAISLGLIAIPRLVEFELVKNAAPNVIMISVLMLLCNIARSYLLGLKKPAVASIAGDTLPMITALVSVLLLRPLGPHAAYMGLLVGYFIGTATQVGFLAKWARVILSSSAVAYETRRWTNIAFFGFVGLFGRLLMERSDAILLAPIGNLSELAVYGAATRLALLLTFVPTVLLPVFGARVSNAFHLHQVQLLWRLLALQVLIVLITTVPLTMLVALFPSPILALVYGERFAAGGQVLLICVCTQAAFALALPFANFLLMTNGERLFAAASVIGALIYLSIGFPAVEIYGMLGAAWASLVGTLVMAGIFILSAASALRRLLVTP